MGMHYCEPEALIREVLAEGLEKKKNLDKSFYLKHKRLHTEDEVRLNYCHRPDNQLLLYYELDKREELEQRLIEQDTNAEITDVLIDYLARCESEYEAYKNQLRGEIDDFNFEEGVYYELPSEINKYILSVKTAPNAPADYVAVIKETCEKYGITNVG
jgi:hypothetical protein